MAAATRNDELSYSEDLDLLPTTTSSTAKPALAQKYYAANGVLLLLLAICIVFIGFLCVALFSHNELEMPNVNTQPLTSIVLPEQVAMNFTVAPPANNISTAQEPFQEHAVVLKEQAEKDEKDDETFQPFESFNHTNPHQKSWCPRATCNNSPLCQPCKKRFLFIIATGRSGSTSLLSMLNFLPGVSEVIKYK